MKKCNFQRVYSVVQEKTIRGEFSRLNDECYLDHAGSTLYSEKQISAIFHELSSEIYGNPHSRNISSKNTEESIDQIRYQVLEFFNTTPEEYSLIFTSGATGALKLIAENFDYGKDGIFAYLETNHTSVLGMREYAKNIKVLTSFEENFDCDLEGNSLFVYPAQCNFSGSKYPLNWIEKLKKRSRNYVMLDAAAFASTNRLDLGKFRPDFVCVSFYKIFGYPTGLGALLVRNCSSHLIKKKYFGGGTVFMALSSEKIHVPRKILHERYEDGTVSFLSILSLRHGFDTLKRLSLNMELISEHVFNLARYVYRHLIRLHHFNEKSSIILYHDSDFSDRQAQGGIINFNVIRSNGEYVGYSEILHVANIYKVHLRTGCFCNPGACRRFLNLSNEDVKFHFESGHVCGDQNDLIQGKPTGSVRISFGYMSNREDADAFLQMIEDCFVEKPVIKKLPDDSVLEIENSAPLTKQSKNRKVSKICGSLEKMFIYPIKSCAAFEVTDWEMQNTGLRYDRNWMIVNSAGVCVSQKKNTKLCQIKPEILSGENCLGLRFEGANPIKIPLEMVDKKYFSKCQLSQICKDKIQGYDCGDAVADWLSHILDTPGLRLLQQLDQQRTSNKNQKQQLSLANEAQFLLINKSSVEWIQKFLPYEENLDNLIARFRPNFLVDFQEEFIENDVRKIQIEDVSLQYEGFCTRCQMICIDQTTGETSVEPLRTISKLFDGKIRFGIYLSQSHFKEKSKICVRSSVNARLSE